MGCAADFGSGQNLFTGELLLHGFKIPSKIKDCLVKGQSVHKMSVFNFLKF